MGETRWHRVYGRLPIWVQNAACSLAGLNMRRRRYNRTFWKALGFLEDSQWWPLEQQQEYQNEQLRGVIVHAYNTVPYYTELFDQLGLTPEDVKTVDDLPKLPILDKETVRNRADDLVSTAWPNKRIQYSVTGGTTGKSLRFVTDRDSMPWACAFWWRHRQRFGLNVTDPFVVFAGRSVIPMSRMDPPFWRRNFPMRLAYVSVHHMTKSNLAPLAEYLNTRKVKYYCGYPSSLYLLADYILQKGIELANPPLVTVTASETLLPHQRLAISQAFECEVADMYDASEHSGSISECEKHSYHIDMESGVVELVEMPGAPSTLRRICLTGFYNLAMPLIRYDIGDIATMGDTKCSCGREAPCVEKIDGRIESYVITPDGRQLGRLDFLFKDTEQIKEAQLVQDSPDRVLVRIVKREGYGDDDTCHLMKNLRKYLGNVIEIDLEYVPQIAREANGKFRQIVSRVFADNHTHDRQER